MQSTQPRTGDNDAFFKVVLALLIALVPFLHGLRAAIAIASSPNKAARLAKIDALIAEFGAMVAHLREHAGTASDAAPVTPPTHPAAALHTPALSASARRVPAGSARRPAHARQPPKPRAHAPPRRHAATP